MVGVWGLPMVVIFMCILLGSQFVFFVCGFKARDV